MALDMRFDSRIVERNIAKGIVTREEYEAYLASLPDAATKAETLDLVQPLLGNDEDEDEDDEDDDEDPTPAKRTRKS